MKTLRNSEAELKKNVYKVHYVGTNEKSDFYELWQKHKQLKIMEMNEAWTWILMNVIIPVSIDFP